MIISKLGNKNYLIRIPFSSKDSILEEGDIIIFFKNIFSSLLEKYSISGNVIVDFYVDDSYGFIIYLNNSYTNLDEDINTKIFFHFNCLFLIEVDYFKYIDKSVILYYYDNKFYKKLDNDYDDGEIVCETEEIINKGIKIHT